MPDLGLPPDWARVRPRLGEIVEIVERRAPYGAVLLSTHQGLRMTVDNREERIAQAPPSSGTVITAFDGATVYERALCDFHFEELVATARDLIATENLAPGAPLDAGPSRSGDFQATVSIPPDTLTLSDKLERCRELRARVLGRDPRIVNVQVGYQERYETSVFRNRAADLAQHIQRLVMSLVVFVADANQTRYDLEFKTTTGGWEHLVYDDDELDGLVQRAIELLSAERLAPGEYTAITAPQVTGILCHESFGHGVETDMFLKERARAAEYIDRPVGSSLVNIDDDPGYPGGYGSYYFDDEGQPAAPTHIVENGIFRRGITDLYSATALRVPRSANGRRQDYTRKAYARMSNTFFVPGSSPVQELFDQVEDGVYLEHANAGVEDPKGWGIQVTCHYGHEIKHGKLTGRIFSPIGVTGYVPEVLASIRAVANDWQLDGGICGKGAKEFVNTSTGGPHLLLKARLG